MQKAIHLLGKVSWSLPFLTGALLALSKFSENSNHLPWGQLGQALGFNIAVAALGLGVFYAVPATRKAAGLIASVFVATTMLWMLVPVPIIAVALMLVAIVVFPRVKSIEVLTTLLVVVLTGACFAALGMAGINSSHIPAEAASGNAIRLGRAPDIYFIVPDRFTSHKGLKMTGYDNGAFMDYLESQGFYVKRDALSLDEIEPTDHGVATTRTGRFMASILNLGREIPLNIPYNVASSMIKHNEFAKILKANNYTYYHIGDWWSETETNPMADVNYVYRGASLVPDQELSMALLDRSIWRYIDTFFWQSGQAYRDRHLYQLASFKEAAGQDSPKFVFLHTLVSHPPFVWAADGTPQDEDLTPYELYVEQIRFTESFLRECIEVISGDAIVIIQSDEGVCFTEPKLNHNLANDQWNGVLSAWRVPGALDDIAPTGILQWVVLYLQEAI